VPRFAHTRQLQMSARLPKRLTAPKSVGQRCAQLRGSGADLALGPGLVRGALAFWMQNMGAAQDRCRLYRLFRESTVAQGCGCAPRLLYFR
jgi:hypothetical protein